MTTECVNYLRILLDSQPGSVPHMIGWRFWRTPDAAGKAKYLEAMMREYPEGSRGWEIAYEMQLLMGTQEVSA